MCLGGLDMFRRFELLNKIMATYPTQESGYAHYHIKISSH
jgi:hypothetical protein